MSFTRRDGELYADEVPVSSIAEQFGTPCYVYSRGVLEDAYRAYDAAFGSRPHRVHYAVKANGNIALLDLLARLGAHFDIVSQGELARVIAAGGDPARVVFSGVGKSPEEIAGALTAGIACINVESRSELRAVVAAAERTGRVARIAVRVNPDVDAETHPYISTGLRENKFGVPFDEAEELITEARASGLVDVIGVACHIGSQLRSLAPFVDATRRVVEFRDRLKRAGVELRHLDLGGGLGIAYGSDEPPAIADYVGAICREVPADVEVHIEPGRSLVGEAGMLLTRVLYLKRTELKTFVICDAAMTELIRPALYQAVHPVVAVSERTDIEAATVDVVGPVCETADFLARDRRLAVAEGDLLAVLDAGAYGNVMASNYNARPRPAEVLIDGDRSFLIRAREQTAALFADERRIAAP